MVVLAYNILLTAGVFAKWDFLKAKFIMMNKDLLIKQISNAETALQYLKVNIFLDVDLNITDCTRHVLNAMRALDKVQLLLKDNTGAITETPHCANTMLSEVSPEVDTSINSDRRGVLGETPAVKQNEQTKEVCPYCKAEIESWFKSCPECREHIYR